jgi:hypothetical protein
MAIGAVDFDSAELSQSFTLTEGGPGAVFLKRIHLVRPEWGTGLAPILFT